MTDEIQQDRVTDGQDDNQGAERAHLAHLEDVEDGCGCAEVWEHLSAQREASAD